MDKELLCSLREKFPKLWAEYPHRFHTFFNSDGTMNAKGHIQYDFLKKRHRERLRKKK